MDPGLRRDDGLDVNPTARYLCIIVLVALDSRLPVAVSLRLFAPSPCALREKEKITSWGWVTKGGSTPREVAHAVSLANRYKRKVGALKTLKTAL